MKTLVGIIFSLFIGGFCGYLAWIVVGTGFGWITAVFMFLFALEVIMKGFEGRHND